MTDISATRVGYLTDICHALAEYVQAGLVIHLDSERTDDSLSIAISLEDADRFHALLSRHMQDRMSAASEPSSEACLS